MHSEWTMGVRALRALQYLAEVEEHPDQAAHQRQQEQKADRPAANAPVLRLLVLANGMLITSVLGKHVVVHCGNSKPQR